MTIEQDIARLTTANTEMSGALDGISDDVAKLKTDLQTVRDQLANSQVSPEALAALSSAVTNAEAIAARAKGIDAQTDGTPPNT